MWLLKGHVEWGWVASNASIIQQRLKSRVSRDSAATVESKRSEVGHWPKQQSCEFALKMVRTVEGVSQSPLTLLYFSRPCSL